MNLNKLKGKMVERQVTTEELAKVIGVSYATLLRRFNAPATFTVREVSAITNALGLDIKDANSIFFNL